MSKTMVLHVSYIFWYISLPRSAKQQREMTSFKVLGEPGTHHGEVTCVDHFPFMQPW